MYVTYNTKIINIVNDLVESLKGIDNLTLENVNDEELVNSFDTIKADISQGIANLQKDIEVLSRVSEWEKLNISFFGETNAGKSTIIESLVNGNGQRVGDGRKDYTKTVDDEFYRQDIDLIDMPGIEGGENAILENIWEAVNKSHVVFYVVGTNKEPEEYTLKKIENFLKDNAKVYSIINVRGKPTAYKYRPTLKDKNILLIEKRIKNRLENLLQGNYSGNIIVNGYLALLTSNNLGNTRFEADQKKACQIFGDPQKLKEYSNIQEVKTTIDELSLSLGDELKTSNTYKFLNNMGKMLSSILREKKSFDVLIKKVYDHKEKYLVNMNNIINKYTHKIYWCRDKNINSLRVNLKKTISNSIDQGDKEPLLKSKIENEYDKIRKDINKEVREINSALTSEIKTAIEEFEDRISLEFSFLDVNGEFDLTKVLKPLKISLSYVLDRFRKIGVSMNIPVLKSHCSGGW